MTPDQLAKSGSEHGEQRALFGWLAVAQKVGFAEAWKWADDGKVPAFDPANGEAEPLLRWVFAVPNGGLRDKITAAKLKHEGVKSGVPDIMVPITCQAYAGLFIEMKRSAQFEEGIRKAQRIKRRAGETSDEQDTWISYLRSSHYAVSVCFDWRSAAKDIQSYVLMATGRT